MGLDNSGAVERDTGCLRKQFRRKRIGAKPGGDRSFGSYPRRRNCQFVTKSSLTLTNYGSGRQTTADVHIAPKSARFCAPPDIMNTEGNKSVARV